MLRGEEGALRNYKLKIKSWWKGGVENMIFKVIIAVVSAVAGVVGANAMNAIH